jgi:hypothetical protein
LQERLIWDLDVTSESEDHPLRSRGLGAAGDRGEGSGNGFSLATVLLSWATPCDRDDPDGNGPLLVRRESSVQPYQSGRWEVNSNLPPRSPPRPHAQDWQVGSKARALRRVTALYHSFATFNATTFLIYSEICLRDRRQLVNSGFRHPHRTLERSSTSDPRMLLPQSISPSKTPGGVEGSPRNEASPLPRDPIPPVSGPPGNYCERIAKAYPNHEYKVDHRGRVRRGFKLKNPSAASPEACTALSFAPCAVLNVRA